MNTVTITPREPSRLQKFCHEFLNLLSCVFCCFICRKHPEKTSPYKDDIEPKDMSPTYKLEQRHIVPAQPITHQEIVKESDDSGQKITNNEIIEEPEDSCSAIQKKLQERINAIDMSDIARARYSIHYNGDNTPPIYSVLMGNHVSQEETDADSAIQTTQDIVDTMPTSDIAQARYRIEYERSQHRNKPFHMVTDGYITKNTRTLTSALHTLERPHTTMPESGIAQAHCRIENTWGFHVMMDEKRILIKSNLSVALQALKHIVEAMPKSDIAQARYNIECINKETHVKIDGKTIVACSSLYNTTHSLGQFVHAMPTSDTAQARYTIEEESIGKYLVKMDCDIVETTSTYPESLSVLDKIVRAMPDSDTEQARYSIKKQDENKYCVITDKEKYEYSKDLASALKKLPKKEPVHKEYPPRIPYHQRYFHKDPLKSANLARVRQAKKKPILLQDD